MSSAIAAIILCHDYSHGFTIACISIALSLGESRESAVEAYPDGRSFPNITVSWTLSECESVTAY